MTKKEHEHWVGLLDALLVSRGLSWKELSSHCRQIILFGSRAAGVAREGSDFDLLCIGSGSSQLGQGLDLVFVTTKESQGSRWLGGELAGHVARYGQWLMGDPDWVHRVQPSRAAIDRKAERLRRRLHAVESTFPLLDAVYLDKHLTLIRRDLQRYESLVKGEPVPPTPLLDQAWTRIIHPQEEMERLARAARLESKFLIERLSAPERWHDKELSGS
ncbi:nucleotidyltransferase domain-containing protein [Hyalangium versicolor]|uniref:nucleotidyltransferase domain-containing protein n=1 Tax=Hyalangium versicolor TaxID=2861190 RepID=UPI001CCFF6D8|nr:nucleotidyltransferase domain-containing protein [Hyalangium versicolor]